VVNSRSWSLMTILCCVSSCSLLCLLAWSGMVAPKLATESKFITLLYIMLLHYITSHYFILYLLYQVQKRTLFSEGSFRYYQERRTLVCCGTICFGMTTDAFVGITLQYLIFNNSVWSQNKHTSEHCGKVQLARHV
jgi:hypothetical protein